VTALYRLDLGGPHAAPAERRARSRIFSEFFSVMKVFSGRDVAVDDADLVGQPEAVDDLGADLQRLRNGDDGTQGVANGFADAPPVPVCRRAPIRCQFSVGHFSARRMARMDFSIARRGATSGAPLRRAVATSSMTAGSALATSESISSTISSR
jgi:hypothetical protein